MDKIMAAFVITLFLSNQWKFAAQFMESAWLFCLVLNHHRHSQSRFDEISRRQKILKFLKNGVYIFLWAFCIGLILMAFTVDHWVIILESYWLLTLLAFVLITIISMRHIHCSSKTLEHVGIQSRSI